MQNEEAFLYLVTICKNAQKFTSLMIFNLLVTASRKRKYQYLPSIFLINDISLFYYSFYVV